MLFRSPAGRTILVERVTTYLRSFNFLAWTLLGRFPCSRPSQIDCQRGSGLGCCESGCAGSLRVIEFDLGGDLGRAGGGLPEMYRAALSTFQGIGKGIGEWDASRVGQRQTQKLCGKLIG